jgi:NADPH:quinone reductase-like Zn-dependent oxidoreductase
MFAVRYEQYGDASVLGTADLPEPHAGDGQIRIAVQSTAVNPMDCKLRAGMFAETMPQTFPVIPGSEASGVVDEIGRGVTGVAVGDEVFGIGRATSAEFAVLDHWALKPASLDWQQAAGVSVGVETAARVLAALGIQPGQTLLIDNASGAVGQAAAQLAQPYGVTVIGTASEGNHARLRELGVIPVTYGPGLPQRVAGATDKKVDVAIDAAGRGSLPELIEITGSAAKVITIADFTAPELGVAVSGTPSAWDALQRAADLAADGKYTVEIDKGYHFNDAADAHRHVEAGHTHGKTVFGG